MRPLTICLQHTSTQPSRCAIAYEEPDFLYQSDLYEYSFASFLHRAKVQYPFGFTVVIICLQTIFIHFFLSEAL